MALYDFLIIGGGIAGTTAAESLRAKDRHASIAILDAEPHPLYSKVLIPFYLKKKIKRDSLFLRQTSDYAAKMISLFPSTEVAKADYDRREVATLNGRIFSYRKLLLASGGRPNPWIMRGYDSESRGIKILRMHTLDDADRIFEEMKNISTAIGGAGRSVLVAGEGFIALEFIETFLAWGLTVHVVANGDYFGEKRFGVNGGKIIKEKFERKGVIIHPRTEISHLNKQGEVFLKNGDGLTPSIVGAGIGLLRNTESFGRIKIGAGKGILTNEFLETSEENVYAAGDVAEFFDPASGASRIIGNWTNSFLQGRAAAFNMLAAAGSEAAKEPFRAVSTYNIVSLGMNLTYVGYLEDADDFWENLSEDGVLRAFLKDGKVRGATLVNRFSNKAKISKLIEYGADKNELEKTFS